MIMHLAQRQKWEIYRKKRDELVAEQNLVRDNMKRANFLIRKLTFYVTLRRFRMKSYEVIAAKIKRMKLIFMINLCKMKHSRRMSYFRKTLDQRILQLTKLTINFNHIFVMDGLIHKDRQAEAHLKKFLFLTDITS